MIILDNKNMRKDTVCCHSSTDEFHSTTLTPRDKFFVYLMTRTYSRPKKAFQ